MSDYVEAPPVYLERRFYVPSRIAVESNHWARQHGMYRSQYGRKAIAFFNIAIEQGYGSSDTWVVRSNQHDVRFPRLSPPHYGNGTQGLDLTLPAEDWEQFEADAQRVHVQPNLRVARALQLMNFVARTTIEEPHIVIQHQSQPEQVIIGLL